MASSAFCLCRATTLLIPYIVLATLAHPASLSSGTKPTATFCFGRRSRTSSSAVTAGEVERFLGAVSDGAHSSLHRSYNASLHIDAQNRTMYAVAQCRPDVPASDCAACLAASSWFLATGAASCADAAVWHEHDRCFFRYSDRDTSRFREDELAATVFNSSGRPARHERAAVTGLLAAVMDRLDRSTQKRRLLGSTRAGDGVAWGWGAANSSAGEVYGVARCAPGIARADCGRCLRGALAVAERDYNGSAGMHVLRLSCTARYESYRFYEDSPDPDTTTVSQNGGYVIPSAGTKSPRAVSVEMNPPAGAESPQAANVGVIPSPPAAFSNIPSPPAAFNNIPSPPAAFSNRTNSPTPAANGLPEASPPGQPQTTSHRRINKTLILVVVFIGTGQAVGSILLIFWLHRRRRQNRRDVVDGMPGEDVYFGEEEHLNAEDDDEDEESTSSQPYSYEILKNATCHFSNSNKLGSGGFGTVYKGTLENGKEVAVKKLTDSKRRQAELEREVSIVAKLRHKNLVRFLGYCLEGEGSLLVYEYLPNNSIDNFWNNVHKLDWEIWFNIIKGVARGLQFLHSKWVIHRDLKPHNVLLDENFNPKIADFDLVRVYNKDRTHESTEKAAGTLGYMAPECVSGQKSQFSIKSDVYSYGVLVLEIITGRKIHTFEGHNSEGLVEYVWQHWTERRVCDVVDSDLDVEAAEQRQRQALRCVHVALLCVQSDRSRRPAMEEVIAMLSTHQDSKLQAPSLPGYLHPKSASGRRVLRPLPCFRC